MNLMKCAVKCTFSSNIQITNSNMHPCGWDTCFYLMGSTSLLWTLAWAFLAHDSPKLHPSITEEVRDSCNLLRRDGSQELAELEAIPVGSKAPPLPWRAVVTSAPVWGIIFTDAANTFGLYSNFRKYAVKNSSSIFAEHWISAEISAHL